jgi:hypothetical protein
MPPLTQPVTKAPQVKTLVDEAASLIEAKGEADYPEFRVLAFQKLRGAVGQRDDANMVLSWSSPVLRFHGRKCQHDAQSREDDCHAPPSPLDSRVKEISQRQSRVAW